MSIPNTPSNSVDPFSPERMKSNLCFCGEKTVEDHDFCFCSPRCAREDALRALDDPECHYRDVVRRACIKAGVAELYPRRRKSAETLCPSQIEERASAKMALRLLRPANAGHRRNKPTYDTPQELGNLAPMSGRMPEKVFPTLSQITGAVLAKKGMTGEQFVAEQRDRPRWQGSGAVPTQPTDDSHGDTCPVISLDVIPLSEDDLTPRRTLRRVPRSTTGLKNNIRKSVAALLNVGKGRSQGIKVTQRKSSVKGYPERDTSRAEPRVFGHPVNPIVPCLPAEPVSPVLRPACVPSAIPIRSSRTLRRSVSFAGRDAIPQDLDLYNDNDSLMQMLAEMREEMRNAGEFGSMSYLDEGEEE
ncbi:hypothetical protein F5I97DRAFT_1929005 [Phlebopus sp. FC_14]|nr:hypothetical protein F5I97DRAFT_1929005 [Phlebopus sp. FC_14]